VTHKRPLRLSTGPPSYLRALDRLELLIIIIALRQHCARARRKVCRQAGTMPADPVTTQLQRCANVTLSMR
jgi:hypothetical protein